jgi:hypothetical protein
MMAFGRLYCFAVVFVLLGMELASGQTALTETQYIDQLERYENQINQLASEPQEAVGFRDSLPKTLTIQTTRGDAPVDLSFLRDALNRFLTATAAEKPNILVNAGARLKAMRAEASLYEQPDRTDDAMRKQLDHILSAREFDRVRGPSPLELLKQRIQSWIGSILKKISPKIPDVQDLGQWLVWGMIALAASIGGVWLYRVSRQTMEDRTREIVPFMPSARNWREWLADARAKAAQGDWRDAIHFGFWAGVSRLESEGVWAPDKTRTPREYLHAIPRSSSSKEPFTAMTRVFEASWYGSRPTTAADFEQFATHLERLGCR